MVPSLTDKVVLVTGASSGIGRAIALRCAASRRRRRRSPTARIGTGPPRWRATIEALGRRAEVVQADVSREDDVAALARAGRRRVSPDRRLDQQRRRRHPHRRGRPALPTREARPRARRRPPRHRAGVLGRGRPPAAPGGGGTIINMAWDHVAAGAGMAGENPVLYAAAKGGVLSFSKSLAHRRGAGDPGQRAGARASSRRRSASRPTPSGASSVVRQTPLRRWGTPDDVAGAAVFLASDDAAFLTGQTIMVNGGVGDRELQEGRMPTTKERTYSEAELAEKLKELPGWYYEDGWIRRVYKTDGWPTTLQLVNLIGYYAEAAYHHPDLSVTWGRVIVKLQNHAAGGITDKDLELAREVRRGGALAAAGRRAGGHAEQVGALGRSPISHGASSSSPASSPSPPCGGCWTEMQPPFETEVVVLGITVAALMTTPWIARHLEAVPPETDLVLIPGLCEGDPGWCGRRSACPWRRGPKTFGRSRDTSGARRRPPDYGAYTIEILAEINNAPKLSARGDPGGGGVFPRERRRRDRHRLYARARLPRARRRGARAPRGRLAGERRQLRPRRDPRRGGGRRGAGAERQRLEPRGRAGLGRDR